MNFSEFKQMLGADPYSKDDDFLSARDSSPEHREAAGEAEAFEAMLKKALSVPVPGDLLDRIQAAVATAEQAASQPWQYREPWQYRAAAAALLAIGVTAAAWWQSARDWESVDDYLVDHWEVDGRAFVEQADAIPANNVEAVFALIGMQVTPEYARLIDFIHACPTPGSRGAHYVVDTDNGPVTLIYMPSVQDVEAHTMTVDNLIARALPLATGSLLVIGPDMASIEPWFALTRDALRPLSQTA